MAPVKTTALWQKPKYETELKQAEEIAKTFLVGIMGREINPSLDPEV